MLLQHISKLPFLCHSYQPCLEPDQLVLICSDAPSPVWQFFLKGKNVFDSNTMCVCVAALKVIVTRYTAQSVMWTCMLPRELIWERVAPSHTGVTQNSGWPLLQLLWSAPEKAQSLMWCAISNVVSLSFNFSSHQSSILLSVMLVHTFSCRYCLQSTAVNGHTLCTSYICSFLQAFWKFRTCTSTLLPHHQILAFMVNMRCLDLLCSADLVSKTDNVMYQCTSGVCAKRYVYCAVGTGGVLFHLTLSTHVVQLHKAMVTPTVKSWSFSGLPWQLAPNVGLTSSGGYWKVVHGLRYRSWGHDHLSGGEYVMLASHVNMTCWKMYQHSTTSHQILAFMVNMRCLDLLCSADLVSKQTMSCTNAYQVCIGIHIVLWDWWSSLLPPPCHPTLWYSW